MKNKTIYQYIIENIDPKEGNFTQETLIDEPYPTVPHPLGAEEAYWLVSHSEPFIPGAEEVFQQLLSYLEMPTQPTKQKLYELLSMQPTIGIAEPLIDKLKTVELEEQYYALARSLFYNAQHRGPVKFAYLLFGCYGMDRIEREDGTLWEDLIKVAQCEEFTYFFTLACDISQYQPNKAFWRLVGCMEGWGKAFAVEHLQCTDEAQELWLVQHGMEITVEYPNLALHILKIANLSKWLKEEELDERTYDGAMAIINCYLLVLNHYDEEVLEEELKALISRILYHAQMHAKEPEKLLQVVNLRLGLENLLDNGELALVKANEGEVLLSQCDSMIYAKDWEPYIKANLVKNGEINYELCDFACEMDMDIWQQIFDFFCEHPLEYKAMAYLFSFNDTDYQAKALSEVERNLPRYQMEESALLVPLRYLAHRPGLGENIIIAALRSLYDWPRGIACSVLNDWGHELLTEPLRNALLEARDLSHNVVVTARIDALLAGHRFGIEDIVSDIMGKN